MLTNILVSVWSPMISVPVEEFFQISKYFTKGHKFKVFKPRCHKSVRRNSFSVKEVVPVKSCFQLRVLIQHTDKKTRPDMAEKVLTGA